MRFMLFGKNGQLGWELHRDLLPLGEVFALDQEDLDLVDQDALRNTIREIKPHAIINAAAYTQVDRAESEPDLAKQINALAPAIMAEEAKRSDAIFIHYSTDYVFDGTKGSPYTERDIPNPINTYGKTKLAGERAIEAIGGRYLIIRTSWLYGLRKPSFVTKVLDWAHTKEVVSIVDDQFGNPTWCRVLAGATSILLAMIQTFPDDWLIDRAGTYHLAGSGADSRYVWAKEILRIDSEHRNQVVKELAKAKSDEFPTLAKRPLFTALDCSRFHEVFALRLPDWKVGLEVAMEAEE
jgi:dTDP-4-dehydrorhamnose reductase